MASREAPRLGGGTVSLDASAFEARFNMPLVHETVRAELKPALYCKVPGPKVRPPPAAPRLPSLETASVPPLIVVPPE